LIRGFALFAAPPIEAMTMLDGTPVSCISDDEQ
jgi:hypothetical protein